MLKQCMEKIDEKNIEYYIGGKGPDLFFIHGMGATPRCYWDALELLTKDFRVIAPCVPCHGKSERIDELNLEGVSDTLIKLIKRLRLNNLTVVGNSMGGLLSIYLAVKLKKKVKYVVLVDSAGLNEHKPIYKYFLGFLLVPITTLGTTMRKDRLKRLKRLVKYGREYAHSGIRCLKHKGFLNFARELVLEDHTKMIKKINCKTLILWGSWDDAVSVNDAWEMSKLIKGSEVFVIDKYFHAWPIVDAELFVEKIVEFVK